MNDETKSYYISSLENILSSGVFEHVEQMLQNNGDINKIFDELEQTIIKNFESVIYVKHTRKRCMKKILGMIHSVNQHMLKLEKLYVNIGPTKISAINACLKTGFNTKPNSSAGNFHQPSLQKTTGQHNK